MLAVLRLSSNKRASIYHTRMVSYGRKGKEDKREEREKRTIVCGRTMLMWQEWRRRLPQFSASKTPKRDPLEENLWRRGILSHSHVISGHREPPRHRSEVSTRVSRLLMVLAWLLLAAKSCCLVSSKFCSASVFCKLKEEKKETVISPLHIHLLISTTHYYLCKAWRTWICTKNFKIVERKFTYCKVYR